MPMSLMQEYLYFLMVASLYGSPFIAFAIWRGVRKKRLAPIIKALCWIVPLAPLALMLLLRGGILVGMFGMEREKTAIDRYLGDPARTAVIPGDYVGSVKKGGLDYRRYQFPSLDGQGGTFLEILVPPDGIHAQAYIRTTDKVAKGEQKARMLVWPSRIGTNPAVATDLFFRENFPEIAPQDFGPHTLVVGLRPRQSIIVHPPVTEGSWLWRDATLDLD